MESSIGRTQIAISGLKGSGKTSFLFTLVDALNDEGLSVSGVLCPATFDGNKKVAIEMVNIATGERRILARLAVEEPTDLQFGDWAFLQETIDWGNTCLSEIESTDVLILDEVGPLELEQGQGVQAGMDMMTRGRYHVGIMSVRPKCLQKLTAFFPKAKVYTLVSWRHEALINEILRIVTLHT
jgi:nucleoside-triphosphatase THEP1